VQINRGVTAGAERKGGFQRGKGTGPKSDTQCLDAAGSQKTRDNWDTRRGVETYKQIQGGVQRFGGHWSLRTFHGVKEGR